MKEEIKIPPVGESIVEGVLTAWLKQNNDYVKQNEDLFEFETEKTSITVPSLFDGVLEIIVSEGTKVKIGQVVGHINTEAADKTQVRKEEKEKNKPEKKEPVKVKASTSSASINETLSPAVRRVINENNIDTSGIKGSGKDGRITKGDLLGEIKQKKTSENEPIVNEIQSGETSVTKVTMSSIRKSIAKRMLTARQEAAHLTTFNEINMEKLIEIRKLHQEAFQKKYGIRLGFMSFFVKASVAALKEFPVVNARIEGDDILYYNFYDIGVAVSTERGLLVPIIRNADKLSFFEIEEKIADLAEKAKNKKITLQELLGGTFSITNGGVFGSLMSTPIPNHPQPAILGMHALKDRPVAVNGEVKIKPMMYVALTYDHRLIDGREAVSFLVRIKEYIEDPEEMLLNI